MAKNLRKQLLLVRDGQISFERFVANTRKDFFFIASNLLRRWLSPIWFTVEDVEQELYLGAWNYIWRFEDGKIGKNGNPILIDRYVVYNAMSQAKRELHRARGVTLSNGPDRKLSNFEATFSSLEDEGESDKILSKLFEPAMAEEVLIEAEEKKLAATKMLKICETQEERLAVLAIREAGSLDTAGEVLYNDFDQRIDLHLGNENRAHRFVFRHAAEVANRARRLRNQKIRSRTRMRGEISVTPG